MPGLWFQWLEWNTLQKTLFCLPINGHKLFFKIYLQSWGDIATPVSSGRQLCLVHTWAPTVCTTLENRRWTPRVPVFQVITVLGDMWISNPNIRQMCENTTLNQEEREPRRGNEFSLEHGGQTLRCSALAPELGREPTRWKRKTSLKV